MLYKYWFHRRLALTTAANFGGQYSWFYWLLIFAALDGRLAVWHCLLNKHGRSQLDASGTSLKCSTHLVAKVHAVQVLQVQVLVLPCSVCSFSTYYSTLPNKRVSIVHTVRKARAWTMIRAFHISSSWTGKKGVARKHKNMSFGYHLSSLQSYSPDLYRTDQFNSDIKHESACLLTCISNSNHSCRRYITFWS
jgi:hypothetical protein